MLYVLDSAKKSEIEKAKKLGVLGGTTNPSLLVEAINELRVTKGQDPSIQEHLAWVCEQYQNGQLSLEVVAHKYEDILMQARALWKFAIKYHVKDPLVKIPITTASSENSPYLFDALRAIHTLSNEGIRLNITVMMSAKQALVAAVAGGHVLSIFAGRVDDYLSNLAQLSVKKDRHYPAMGMQQPGEKAGIVFKDMAGNVSGIHACAGAVYGLHELGFDRVVLAASIRNVEQAAEAQLVGCTEATLPYSVLEKFLSSKPQISALQFDHAQLLSLIKELRDYNPAAITSLNGLREILCHPKTLEAVELFDDAARQVPEYWGMLGTPLSQ